MANGSKSLPLPTSPPHPPSLIHPAADPRAEMVEQVQQDSKNALRVQQVNKVNKTSAASCVSSSRRLKLFSCLSRNKVGNVALFLNGAKQSWQHFLVSRSKL